MPVTSIDLASDSMLERVAKAVEAGNTITAASLAADGSTAIYDAFFAAAINEDNIDSMFVSWWNGANVGGVTRTQLLNRWFSMLNDDKIFGVKFPKFVTSQSSDGELIEYNWDKIHEKLGVYPDQVIDYKALRGDTSDNIPGIRAIGEKTAVKLLAEFKTVDKFFA